MVPQVLGVYVSMRNERAGMGTTSRDVAQKIYWLAAWQTDGAGKGNGLPDLRGTQGPASLASPASSNLPDGTGGGRYILQPLTDAQLPSGLVKELPEADFIEHFLPDAECYEAFILPAAEALAAYIDALPEDAPFSVELYSPLALPFDQLRVLDGLLAVLRGKPGLVPRAHDIPDLRAMLAGMSRLRMVPDFQNRVTGVAIALRKRGDFAAAEYYYERALAVSGQEDRILFNLARVYYETGRAAQAADCLRRALAANPGLAVAEQFLRFVLTGMRTAEADAAAAGDADAKAGAAAIVAKGGSEPQGG